MLNGISKHFRRFSGISYTQTARGVLYSLDEGMITNMQQARFQNNLTEGPIARQLIRFSLPFLLSNALQALYALTDMLILGWFGGAGGISGVHIGGQVTMIVTNFVAGITVGTTVLIAQYQGANRPDDTRDVIQTTLAFALMASAVLTAIMIVAAPSVLTMMKTPEEAYGEALAYLRVCMTGVVFIFGYNAINAILRGMGDSTRPLWFIAIACLINIGLDFLLVACFGMGAGGAAIATVVSQAIALAMAVVYLKSRAFVFDFKPSSFRIVPDKLKLLVQVGLPVSIQNVLTSLSFAFNTSLVNQFGLAASTGLGITSRFNSFAMLPAMAMSMALSAFTGQNVGAGKHARALRSLWIGIGICFSFALVVFAWAQLSPSSIIGIFSRDAEVLEVGSVYMRAFSWDFLLVAFIFCLTGFINGSGHTTFSLAQSLVCAVVLRVPLAYFFSSTMGMGVAGIGLAAPGASLLGLAASLAYVLLGKWKTAKIIQRAPDAAMEPVVSE